MLSVCRNSHTYLTTKEAASKKATLSFYRCFICALAEYWKIPVHALLLLKSATLPLARFLSPSILFIQFNVKLKLDKATKQCTPAWHRVHDMQCTAQKLPQIHSHTLWNKNTNRDEDEQRVRKTLEIRAYVFFSSSPVDCYFLFYCFTRHNTNYLRCLLS